MSGPIVRKYGFPNFEKIFGEREMKHGADEPEQGAAEPDAPKKKAASKEGGKPASKPPGKSKPK